MLTLRQHRCFLLLWTMKIEKQARGESSFLEEKVQFVALEEQCGKMEASAWSNSVPLEARKNKRRGQAHVLTYNKMQETELLEIHYKKVAAQRRKCAEGEASAYKDGCAVATARHTHLEMQAFEMQLQEFADAEREWDTPRLKCTRKRTGDKQLAKGMLLQT